MMECCHVDDMSLAFLQAEWIPVLTDCTSVSVLLVPLSQVLRGCPQGFLQRLGSRSDTQ